MIAEVKLDMKNVVSVVVMQDTTIDGNNGLNKIMNNAIQMGFASIRRRFEDMDAVTNTLQTIVDGQNNVTTY